MVDDTDDTDDASKSWKQTTNTTGKVLVAQPLKLRTDATLHI